MALATDGRAVDSQRVKPYEELGIRELDEAEVVSFISGILDDECGLNVGRRLARSVHKFFVEFQPEAECLVALCHSGSVRALMAIDYISDRKAILKWFFVGQEDRNAGLGNRLLDRAVGFAEEQGYEKLVLGTMSRMEAAHHLYRKKGFVYKQQVTFWHRPMMIYERQLSPAGSADTP